MTLKSERWKLAIGMVSVGRRSSVGDGSRSEVASHEESRAMNINTVQDIGLNIESYS